MTSPLEPQDLAVEQLGIVPIDKPTEIKCAAEALYCRNVDWIVFYREILGKFGLIRRNYPTLEAQAEFEKTDAYRQIHRMLTDLRRRSPAVIEERRKKAAARKAALEAGIAPPPDKPQPATEPTRVITVRIPKSMHEALCAEAHEHQTSVNKLCISKLLQFIDHAMIPTAQEGISEVLP